RTSTRTSAASWPTRAWARPRPSRASDMDDTGHHAAGGQGGSAPAGARRVDVRVRRAGTVAQADDWLADEVPVALIFNGISHAVMLATPLDLEDFALGFGLTEGLLERPDELYGVEAVDDPAGLRVEMDVSSAC